jgi:hypothetical protein
MCQLKPCESYDMSSIRIHLSHIRIRFKVLFGSLRLPVTRGTDVCQNSIKYLRTSELLPQSHPLHSQSILSFTTMQFFKSTILLAVAFVTFAAAAPGGETEDWNKPKPKPEPECKPLLQSCGVNSECCGDLCVAGVSAHKLSYIISELTDLIISQLCI